MRFGCVDRCHQVRKLYRENERLRDENARLRAEVDKVRREGKRQAGPFSKGPPKRHPRSPGRRPGKDYGPKAHRLEPDHVDRVIPVPVPHRCPDCGGPIEGIRTEPQFQEELPRARPFVTRFDVAIGTCAACGKRVQGRHPQQTSDALGAAANQIGARAVALGGLLNKQFGLSFGKVSRLFADAYDLTVTASGLCLATARLARVAEPTYDAFTIWIRTEPIVSPDETGWKVAGHRAWLWAFVAKHLTVYSIQQGRGFEEAARILGENFAGSLNRDGWGPYRSFLHALHQTCLAHLLRRCHELIEVAQRGAARLPWAVHRILEHALALRDRRDAGTLGRHGLAVARGRLEATLDRLLGWQPTDEENRKLLKHLRTERHALFWFLYNPEVPATNWWAEQAIRPAVVTRKNCGGNRTWAGAHAQEILASLFRTARQQGHDPLGILQDLLRSPRPQIATLLAPPRVRAQVRTEIPRAPS